MIETIPNILEDAGFCDDGRKFIEYALKNKSIRISDFETTIANLMKSAYEFGLQTGFNTGYRIASNRK